MAPPTKKRGISHGISFSTTKITLKIPTFSLLWHCGRGYPNLCDCANQRDGSFGMPLAYTNQKNRPFGLQTKRTVPLVCGLRQRLESATPHHQRRSPQRGRWHRQKDKNRSPSAKNQSSKIRLSESANIKIPEFHHNVGTCLWHVSLQTSNVSAHWKHTKGIPQRCGVIILDDFAVCFGFKL